jgi:hypothetical protein
MGIKEKKGALGELLLGVVLLCVSAVSSQLMHYYDHKVLVTSRPQNRALGPDELEREVVAAGDDPCYFIKKTRRTGFEIGNVSILMPYSRGGTVTIPVPICLLKNDELCFPGIFGPKSEEVISMYYSAPNPSRDPRPISLGFNHGIPSCNLQSRDSESRF